MHALGLILVLLQAPGDGWALAQPPPREVKSLYWDLFGTTETWVSIIPADPAGGRALVRLVFQAFFVGKEAKGAPSRLVLRALALPMTVVSKYPLRLIVDDHETIDLGASCVSPGTGSGPPPCQLLYPVCDQGCSANGVAVDIQPALLNRLGKAHAVTGTALGFSILLTSKDRAAIGDLAKTIERATARE
ncbi:MAG: hypothetical protein ACHQNV_02180 [Vicinamibacteria bacterium]